MKTSAEPGPDGLLASFIGNCSHSPAEPLLAIFNSSLDSGVFPTLRKSSFIASVLKTGKSDDATDYRPISVLSVLSKLFECIVTTKLRAHFQAIVAPQQHGFTPGRSTTTNLTLFSNFIADALLDYTQVDCFYNDFYTAMEIAPNKFKLRILCPNPFLARPAYHDDLASDLSYS